jgi:hypothetical protein
MEPTKDGHTMSGNAWVLSQARFPKLYVAMAYGACQQVE